jgi:hypothetical protein
VRLTLSLEQSEVNAQTAAKVTDMEQCALESELRQVKVEIEPTSGPGADRISRECFYANDGQEVRHNFTFLDRTPSDVRQYWVRITPREELEKDAYRLDNPVEVEIAR